MNKHQRRQSRQIKRMCLMLQTFTGTTYTYKELKRMSRRRTYCIQAVLSAKHMIPKTDPINIIYQNKPIKPLPEDYVPKAYIPETGFVHGVYYLNDLF